MARDTRDSGADHPGGRSPRSAARARLLDCGAATGFLLDVARDLGYDPYGLELSEFGAGVIAGKLGADRVFCGELQHAKFDGVQPGGFDVVTMCDYIEHVR